LAAMQPLLFMLLMFAVFYFILIRPQVKKQKLHQSMLSALKKGDMVVTRGGVIGRISGIKDERELILEVQEKVRIRVLRSAIESKYEAAAEASTAKAA
jgi:preprotein translocase subunit YajC